MTDNLDWTTQQALLAGPMLSATGFLVAPSETPALTLQVIADPTALQKLRIYTASIDSIVDLSGLYLGDVSVHWVLTDLAGDPLQLGTVGGPVPPTPLTWPQGLDMPYGQGLYLSASSAGWADGELSISVTYALIG